VQRDIHDKREQRKHKIASLTTEIACNDVLLRKLAAILGDFTSSPAPLSYYSTLVERLEKNPAPDAPPVNSLGQAPTTTYDAMVLSLLRQVSEEAKKKTEGAHDEDLTRELAEGLKGHITNLGKVQADHQKDLALEKAEQAKKITVEDIHEGFSSKVACHPLS
jgi:cell division cycle protein 37